MIKESQKSILVFLIGVNFLLSSLSKIANIGGIVLEYPFFMVLILFFILDLYKNGLKKKNYKLSIAIFLWIIWGFFTVFISKNYTMYINYFKTILIELLFFYIVISLNTILDIKNLLRICCVFSFPLILMCLYEGLTGNHFVVLTDRKMTLWASYIWGPMGNVNDLATILFVIFSIFILNIHICKNKLSKIFLFLITLIICWEIVLTTSRGAIFGIVIFLIIYALLFVYYIFKINRNVLGFVMMILLLSALMILLYKYWVYNSKGSSSDSTRKILYKKGLVYLFENFGIGAGIGQSFSINKFPMHSYFLELLIDNGLIFGSFGIIISFFAYLPKLSNIKNFTTEQQKLAFFCVSFSVSWFIVGFSSSLALSKTKIVWILYGVLLAIKRNNYVL